MPLIDIYFKVTAMYRVWKFVTKQNRHPLLWEYFHSSCSLSKKLRNAALFRIRQRFTSQGKDKLTDNEQQVEDEINIALAAYDKMERPGRVITWLGLERIMRANKNPDFNAGLPKQSSVAVLKDVYRNFKGWLEALQVYKTDPSSFTGRPKMPGYIKSDLYKTTFTNQDCVVYPYKKRRGYYLKLPKTKTILELGDFPVNAVVKEVQVIPYYGDFQVIVIFETPDTLSNSDMPHIGAIDLGVDNLATLVTNADIPAVVYKGGPVKSCNQWYNKRISELKSILMKGKDPEKFRCPTTKQMMSLSRYRDCFIEDYFHKIAADITRRLINAKCGILVVGVNEGWKQEASIGHVNNQNFVQIPHFRLRQMLKYLCERSGILYVEREESYTSKASLLDNDRIPVYGKDDAKPSFSGRRITRGLYRSKGGIIINADVNGAGNILRKEFPEALKSVDMQNFIDVEVVYFSNLYLSKQRKPVKRLAAA